MAQPGAYPPYATAGNGGRVGRRGRPVGLVVGIGVLVLALVATGLLVWHPWSRSRILPIGPTKSSVYGTRLGRYAVTRMDNAPTLVWEWSASSWVLPGGMAADEETPGDFDSSLSDVHVRWTYNSNATKVRGTSQSTGTVLWEQQFQHSMQCAFGGEGVFGCLGADGGVMLDPRTGKVQRQFEASFPESIDWVALTADGSFVGLSSRDSTTVRRVTPDGRVAWSWSGPRTSTVNLEVIADKVVVDGLKTILDAATGKVRFASGDSDRLRSFAVLGDRLMMRDNNNGYSFKVSRDAATWFDLDGKRLPPLVGSWSVPTSDIPDVDEPIVTTDETSSHVYDRAGSPQWSAAGSLVSFCGGKALLILGNEGGSASLVARDRVSGAEIWTAPLGDGLHPNIGRVCDGAHFIAGLSPSTDMYAAPTSLVAFNLTDGSVAWRGSVPGIPSGTSYVYVAGHGTAIGIHAGWDATNSDKAWYLR